MKILKAFESLYHLLSGAKNFLYEKKVLNTVTLPVPVVSVGNLSFGGVGKTPCIIMLAKEFSRNYKVTVVTKSYKTSLKKPARVSLKLPEAPLIYGDEACEIKASLPNCEVWTGPQKYLTALEAMVDKPQLILIDDGFSHRQLSRNFDLVLIDATEGLENYLRESKNNLHRAGAVLITKVNIADPSAVERIKSQIVNLAPQLQNKIYTSTFRTHISADRQNPLFVFCGLGRPETFLKALKHMGFKVIQKQIFADHHQYSAREQKSIYARFLDLKNEHRGLRLVTTGKDFVKLTDKDLKENVLVADHLLLMEDDSKEVLIEKIRKSF